tara:strand:+ start:337 stop:741 length:405 start_codon:yes stop_codon:yes gene_type:complete
MKHEGITLVADAIHNQAEPRHYMTIKESPKFWLAKIEEHVLAKSHTAIELKEVGLDIYPPVIYFPLKDVVTTRLRKNKKNTFCPLKGSTYYLDLLSSQTKINNVAWVYETTIADASKIKNMMAFDTSKVSLISH